MAQDVNTGFGRKTYESPRILWSEPLQAVAVTCAKADDATCAAGPIAS